MSASGQMNNEAVHVLENRFVLFSCEGTAEGVIVQTLYDNDLLIVPQERVVKDVVMVNRPYTRKRKASEIADLYFAMDYEADGADGLAIARIVDSGSGKFEFPKRRQNGTEVLSFITRPEIEMLAIHNEDAFSLWQRLSRKNRQLRPSDFCRQELGLRDIKEKDFLERYWSNPCNLVASIRMHAEKTKRGSGELLLVDLLK